MGKMYQIEYQCRCVGQFGPNPDCVCCGGDGSVCDYVPTLPHGYPENEAKVVYGPNMDLPRRDFKTLPPFPAGWRYE